MLEDKIENDRLVCIRRVQLTGGCYDIHVYCRPGGNHVAKTFFTPTDVIVNDGLSLEDAFEKHAKLLPLAITSRHILREYRTSE